jgi:uncharacterized membrane protein YhaH (DUF805 family)
MKWLTGPLKKYAEFSGRASRQEFWMWILSVALAYIGLFMLAMLEPVLGFVLMLGYLGTLIPHLAVGVRRLHDTNRSGWWLLISFVPLIGGIVWLVFLATPGTIGSNDYGPDPKGQGTGVVGASSPIIGATGGLSTQGRSTEERSPEPPAVRPVIKMHDQDPIQE